MSDSYMISPDDFIDVAKKERWDIFTAHVSWFYDHNMTAFEDALKWVIAYDNIQVFEDVLSRHPITLKTSHKRIMLLTDSIQILQYLHHNNDIDSQTFSSQHYGLLLKNHSYKILYFFIKHNMAPLSPNMKSEIVHATEDDGHVPACYLCAQYLLNQAEWDSFDMTEHATLFKDPVLVHDAISCLMRTNFLHYCESKALLDEHLRSLGFIFNNNDEKSTQEECLLLV